MSTGRHFTGDNHGAHTSGVVAFDRDRHWCAECKARVWLEFTTRNGRLLQLPMPCGHKFDPEAEEPTPEPDIVQTLNRACLSDLCETPVHHPRSLYCRPCYDVHRKRLQSEWKARRKATA